MQKELVEKHEIREQYSKTSGWYYEARKILYSEQTKFQKIELLETEEFGLTLLLDGATQIMEKVEFQYHEPLVHIPMLSHPKSERVLIIGGGDGVCLKEVLKYNSVSQVDFVELDENVVKFSQIFLNHLNANSFVNKKVRIHYCDGRHFVEQSAQKIYDVIIMDMTDPSGPSVKLYTKEFFESVSKILKDENSYFIMHSESPDTCSEVFTRIHQTLKTVFPIVRGIYNFIRMYGTLWSFAIASYGSDPANISKSTIDQRIFEQKLECLKLITSDTWPSFFSEYPYIASIRNTLSPIITDENSIFL